MGSLDMRAGGQSTPFTPFKLVYESDNYLRARWVYIIEGLFSVICAVIAWFGLPNDPTNAYFLNDEEKEMMKIRNVQRKAYLGRL